MPKAKAGAQGEHEDDFYAILQVDRDADGCVWTILAERERELALWGRLTPALLTAGHDSQSLPETCAGAPPRQKFRRRTGQAKVPETPGGVPCPEQSRIEEGIR